MQHAPAPNDGLVLCEGDPNEWSVAMTRPTIERILKSKDDSFDKGDMVALWMFYAYTCRWQETQQARATTGYVAEGLGWSEARVRKAKKGLIEMGLVEDARATDAETGQVCRWFVKVRYLVKRAESTLTISHSVENGTVWDSERQMHIYSKGKPSSTLTSKSPQPPEGDTQEESPNSNHSTTPFKYTLPRQARPPSQWEPTPEQKRINSWFGRRDTTRWNARELRAFGKLPETLPEDWDLLGEYTMNSPYRRRDILTLLNNWQGEIDRARQWQQEKPASSLTPTPQLW